MAWEYDKFKAQIYFTHLIRASHKFEERHIAKEELADSLTKLSKFKVNKEFKKEIKLLKEKIDSVIEKQKGILKKGQESKSINQSLKTKIHVLEGKLTDYIQDRKKKNERIKELETKIKAREAKKQKISNIQGELEGLETVYETLKESGQLSETQLHKLETKISLLKVKLQASEDNS